MIDIQNSINWAWAKVMSVTNFESISVKSIFLFIALPFACMLVEALIIGWRKSSLYILLNQYKKVKTDLWCLLMLALGVHNLVGILFTFGVFYWGYGWVQKHGSFQLINHIGNGYVQFGFMLLVGDFKNYIRHWFFHKIGWAWELHKFHHSAEEFTMLTYHRNHAAATILSNFFDLFPFIIFGAGFKEIAAVYLFREAHQYFVHSQLRGDWGWIGRYILVSPLAHRIHHSTNPAHFDKNIGSTFIFWDRLFGTYLNVDEKEVPIVGIPDSPYNQHSFLYDYWLCYKLSFFSIFNLKEK